MHAPYDDIVSIDNASKIFLAAHHPKSFVSLDTADHLLSKRADCEYVASIIAAWAGRYLPVEPDPDRIVVNEGNVVVTETDGKFAEGVSTQHHEMIADEPARYGGANTGPTPYEYLLGALGNCTVITMRMYATRKKLPVRHISVRLSHEKMHAQDCEQCETIDGKVDSIKQHITLEGDRADEQRSALHLLQTNAQHTVSLNGEIEVLTSHA